MKRIVTQNDADGRSYIVTSSITNVEVPLPEINETFKFYNLWTTNCMPVKFSNDPTVDTYVSTSPLPNGSTFRIVNYPPERQLLHKIKSMSTQELLSFEKNVGVKLDLNGKHPLMHMTHSIDFCVVLQGQIYLMLDNEEILLQPFDTIIQQGTNHAWSNRSNKDCLVAYVLLDAKCDIHLT